MSSFCYPVKFQIGLPRNQCGWEVIEWLEEVYDLKPELDYQVDMHRGLLDYVTFSFKDKNTALMTKLAWV